MFDIIQNPVLELAEALQGALLYLDAGAGEIAQTTLGLPFLLGLGVSHVCSLEMASPADAAYPVLTTGQAPTRLAIFTTQMLTDVHPHVLRAVLAHPAATSVSVYCSVTEHAHATCQGDTASELGVEAYRDYAELLRGQVRRARAVQPAPTTMASAPGSGGGTESGAHSSSGGGAQLAVRVSFLPLLVAALDLGWFVLPAGSSAVRRGVTASRAAGYGAFEASSGADRNGGGGSGGGGNGGGTATGGLALTAHSLLALAAALGAPRPETFPIGPVSSALASELATLPSITVSSAAATATSSSGAAAASPNSLAIILVDRALDLAAPCSHGDHPWELLTAAAAARQAVAATAVAVSGAASDAGGKKRTGHDGALAVWRPLELRTAVPGAEPIALEVPWPDDDVTMSTTPVTDGTLETDATTNSAAVLLPYGQWSYTSYGVELFDPTDRTAVARLEAVAGRCRRDGLAALRRYLKEALRTEKLTPAVRSKAGAVQAPELRGLAEPLLETQGPSRRHRGVASLALSLSEAMTSPQAAEWEAAAGLGRSVLAALAGGGGGGGSGSGSGSEAAVQVLMDALEAARQGRGLLHVGHVLEVLPLGFSAAADSDTSSSSLTSSSSVPSSPSPFSGGNGGGKNSGGGANGGGKGSGGGANGGGGPFSAQQQTTLRGALTEVVLACDRPQAALAGRLPYDLIAALVARQRQRGEGGEDAQQQEAEDVVRQRLAAVLDSLFSGLGYVAVARERLKTFRKVTHVDMFAEAHGSLNPLLRQVVRKVLQRAEVSDWQQQPAATSGGGLVRGLLGGLMGASRALVGRAAGGGGGLGSGGPLPGEYGTVLVFVVGGISAMEVREVRSEIEEYVGPGKPRVLLGGTSLLLPQDVTFQLASRLAA